MTVLTCPGSRKPSSATCGASTSARSAVGMVLWPDITRKFPAPLSRASCRLAATAGAVVSNPTARKTTERAGSSSAIRRASRGE